MIWRSSGARAATERRARAAYRRPGPTDNLGCAYASSMNCTCADSVYISPRLHLTERFCDTAPPGSQALTSAYHFGHVGHYNRFAILRTCDLANMRTCELANMRTCDTIRAALRCGVRYVRYEWRRRSRGNERLNSLEYSNRVCCKHATRPQSHSQAHTHLRFAKDILNKLSPCARAVCANNMATELPAQSASRIYAVHPQ